MHEIPQEKEMIISVPQAMQRYFHELIAGGTCVVVATFISLTMMYQVLSGGDPEWLRMIYFLVIAFSLAILILGFRIVIDSEGERPLAAKHVGREWIMDDQHLTISLALLEGKERTTLRKFKTGAVRIEWQDITKVVLKDAVKPPKALPATMEIYVENHEDTLGFNSVLRIRRDLLSNQEPRILDFFRRHKVTIA